MKLKIEQVQLALNCLSQLDGYEQVAEVVAKDGSVSKKVVKKPYKFSGKTRLRLADNMSLLEAKMRTFEKVRNDLITEISDGANEIKKDDKERMARYLKEITSVLDEESDFPGLAVLSAYELGLDSDEESNPIPIEVIKQLRQIKLIA